MRLFKLVSFLLLATALAAGQSIHQEIKQVYSFEPHLLDQKQIDARSAELDKFWQKAKASKSAYIPGLRGELADFSNPPYFLFDGSMLLLELSDTHEDRKIAASAIAHCDLRDLSDNGYFQAVHRLADQGEDTTAAAFRILDNPKFHVVVPQHALVLGQNYSLIYMLLPTDQQFWEVPAMTRLKAEKDVTAEKSLLLLLFYAQTYAADQAIGSVANDSDRADEVRAFARELSARKPGAMKSILGLGSEANVREQRRKRMQAVSDEALTDLDQLTLRLMAMRKR